MNKRNWPTKASQIVILILILGVGVTLGILIKGWSYFVVKREIDLPASILTLVSMTVTIFAAFWVAKVLESEKEEKRTEKNLIIGKVQDLSQKIDQLGEKVNTGSILFIEVTALLKRIGMSVKMIKEVVAIAQLHNCQIIEGEISRSFQTLKGYLTTTPIGSQTQHIITVANDVITINSAGMVQIESQLEILSNNILKYQLEINRA